MAQMTVRGIREDVMKTLKRIAKERGISVEAFVRETLEATVSERRSYRAQLERYERMAARMTPLPAGTTTQLVRESRDEH